MRRSGIPAPLRVNPEWPFTIKPVVQTQPSASFEDIAETVTFSESTSAVKSLVRGLTDSATSSDSLSRVTGVSKSNADSITSTEALTRVVASHFTTTESLSFSESLTNAVGRTRAITGSVSFAESLARSISKSVALTGSLTLGESLSRAGYARARSLADSFVFSDVASLPVPSYDSVQPTLVEIMELTGAAELGQRTTSVLLLRLTEVTFTVRSVSVEVVANRATSTEIAPRTTDVAVERTTDATLQDASTLAELVYG